MFSSFLWMLKFSFFLFQGALIRARELAKKEMLSETITNSERAVLDARQKALKVLIAVF
jgi:DNA polymerase elongation subunit (family B)